MKLIIRAIVTTCIAGVIFLTIMAVSGRMNRSMELKSNLPSAAEETAENLLAKKYDVADKSQLEADFLETLAYAIDSDSDIRLKVNAADKEKQLLSISVTEEFKHPNGKPGTVSYDRTAVVNKLQEEVLETYQVSYYLMNTDTDCYKCYTVHADDMIPVPKDPVAEGKTFTGWADAEGNALDQNMTMTQDAAYYAVWN
nr:InlB B-repeat-containing protein [Roseburia inulinivorans]